MTHQQLIRAALAAGAVVLILVWRYRWVIALWALFIAVDLSAASTHDDWHKWAIYAAIPAAFLAWVLLFPYADCPVCKGKGGSTFLLMSRRCWWCNGGKSKQRFTARLLGRGYPRQPGTWIAPKTRGKN